MIKRILSIVLAVCMLGSVAVVAASAEETPQKTFNYVAFGDSIAAGYGLTAPGTAYDPALVLSEELIANPIQDAYAHVFGERLAEIGAEYGYTTTATNLSTTAYRAEDVAQTIATPGYKGAVAALILESFVAPGASEALTPYHDIFNKYLPEADMVSVQLGGNDIVMGVIYPMIQSDNPILRDTAISMALLLFGQSAETALGAGVTMLIRDKDLITMQHIAEAAKYFAGVVKNKEQYVINSANYVDSVLDVIKSVNPGAAIALIGMFNPYGNSLEYDGQVRDLATVVQNMFVKAVAETIDFKINIGGVEIVSSEEAAQRSEELDKIADELYDTTAVNNYFDKLRRERVKRLVTIAAEELAYPIQYLTAGKNVDPQMRQLNCLLQDIADKYGATYVDVYDISNECNTDPHPTAAGHKEIADRLEAAMYGQIVEMMTKDLIFGDVNMDGVVNIQDATDLQSYLAEFENSKPINLAAADINGDGDVTVSDLTALQRLLAADAFHEAA